MVCENFLDMTAFILMLLLVNGVKICNGEKLENLSIEKIAEDHVGSKSEKEIEIGLKAREYF